MGRLVPAMANNVMAVLFTQFGPKEIEGLYDRLIKERGKSKAG